MKTQSIAELVDARLREIGFHPVPKPVRDGFIAKVQDNMASVVKETIPDWSAVGKMSAKVDPTKSGQVDTQKPTKEAGKQNS